MPRDDELLTTAELAAELKVSPRTLQRWRAEGSGPPTVRVGRGVRYRRRDVNVWLERRDQADDNRG